MEVFQFYSNTLGGVVAYQPRRVRRTGDTATLQLEGIKGFHCREKKRAHMVSTMRFVRGDQSLF